MVICRITTSHITLRQKNLQKYRIALDFSIQYPPMTLVDDAISSFEITTYNHVLNKKTNHNLKFQVTICQE